MSEPLSSAASTTTVPSVNPLISRLRRGKWNWSGGAPHGNSETSAPCCAIASASAACQRG
jgi:hypothetical protein